MRDAIILPNNNSFNRVFWALLSFLMPKTRPLEVLYGRARYCHGLFDQEYDYIACVSNWRLLLELFDRNSVLAINSLYGARYAVEVFAETHLLHRVGDDLYKKKDLYSSDDEREKLARECWFAMKHQVTRFLAGEPPGVARGAKKYCEMLRSGKRRYIQTKFRHYSIFSL